jgi:hypothetical protein
MLARLHQVDGEGNLTILAKLLLRSTKDSSFFFSSLNLLKLTSRACSSSWPCTEGSSKISLELGRNVSYASMDFDKHVPSLVKRLMMCFVHAISC